MASSSVQSVRWRDYSKDGVSGDVFTLSVSSSKYLLTALAVFITLVGNSVWSIVAFTHHQLRARNDAPQDGLFWQIQVLLRHSNSPGAALRDASLLWWAWRGKSKRVASLMRRLLLIMIPPMLVFAAFVVAGISVSHVAHEAYQSNNVLLTPDKCGMWNFNLSNPAALSAAQKKNANDTRTARLYVQNCYRDNPSSSSCSFYPRENIKLDTNEVDCPFGRDPLGDSLCLNNNGKAIRFDTGFLDSNMIFGINTDRSSSVMMRKVATCSPLHAQSYVTVSTSEQGGYATWNFALGSLNGTNLTYSYNTYGRDANIGYGLYSVYTVNNVWRPIEELDTPDADVSAHFLSQNSIKYGQMVDDIWFSAKQEIDRPGRELYGPDQFTTVLACAEQYQLQNPVTKSSSTLSTIENLIRDYETLGWSPFQVVLARRFILGLDITTIFNTVTNLGPSSLLASDYLYELRGTGLPDNQWILEAQGWFQTGLARLQWYMLELASNTADLGQYGYIVQPDRTSTHPEDKADVLMCSLQRVRNIGGYQTFSFAGVMTVVVVGLVIMIISVFLELIVEYVRARQSYRSSAEIARVHDSKYQLLRKNLSISSGSPHISDHLDVWEKVTDIIPVARPSTLFHISDSNEGEFSKWSPTRLHRDPGDNSDGTELVLLRSK